MVSSPDGDAAATWIRPISADLDETADTVGRKACGLADLHCLGLPVPPAFVITAAACRAFLDEGRLPDGLSEQLTAAIADLEAATGRRFGGAHAPLAVSVRSGASVSMPGMMSTVLNLGLTSASAAALAAETGDAGFARDARLRFVASFAGAVGEFAPSGGRLIPDDAAGQLAMAIEAVFSSWNTPRARTYRELNDIPHDLGTAVIVQAMVFGNRDEHSGTGVAFSRNPNTGEPVPYGDVLFGAQGEEVVSGRSSTLPLHELADREPAVWSSLLAALARIEAAYRDACYVEFTFQAGTLWLLQVRPGRFDAAAAVRLCVDLADEQVVSRAEAVLRVGPQHLANVRTPRIASAARAAIVATGVGACPGVAVGRVATTTEAALRLARRGPVILVRPETSPQDVPGLAAAAGIVTARGGVASHAAVVARAMRKPAVVGVAGLMIDGSCATIGEQVLHEGSLVTIDGGSGEVVLGRAATATDAADAHLARLLAWADEVSGDSSPRAEAERLSAAHEVLRRRS